MSDEKKSPTPERRVIAELVGQRNSALDALAHTGAELGATRGALEAAEARIKELEADGSKQEPRRGQDHDDRLRSRQNPLGSIEKAAKLLEELLADDPIPSDALAGAIAG